MTSIITQIAIKRDTFHITKNTVYIYINSTIYLYYPRNAAYFKWSHGIHCGINRKTISQYIYVKYTVSALNDLKMTLNSKKK